MELRAAAGPRLCLPDKRVSLNLLNVHRCFLTTTHCATQNGQSPVITYVTGLGLLPSERLSAGRCHGSAFCVLIKTPFPDLSLQECPDILRVAHLPVLRCGPRGRATDPTDTLILHTGFNSHELRPILINPKTVSINFLRK